MSALVESMNEVTRLRTKHLDYGEWEDGDEHYDECGEDYDLGQWHRDVTRYPDAAGVGTISYDERVRRAAAPLKRTSDYHRRFFLDRRTSYLQPETQLRPPLQRPQSIHRTTRLMRS